MIVPLKESPLNLSPFQRKFILVLCEIYDSYIAYNAPAALCSHK